MAQQNIDGYTEGFGRRIKKYDSYSPRPGSLHRTSFSAPQKQHKGAPSTQSTLVMKPVYKQQLSPQRFSSPVLINQHKKNNINERHNTHTHQSRISGSVQKHQTHVRSQGADVLALKAVHTAKNGEGAVFSDQFSAIYTSGKRKASKFQKILYGVGLAVFLFSLFVSMQSFMTNKQAQEQIATLGENTTKDEQGVSEGTSEDPSEEPIPEHAIFAYKPANPEDPKIVRIAEIGVVARIKNLGVTPGGAVDTPKNIYDAGWYSGGARPGNPVGSSLILGHVSGWTGPGIFKNINKLHAGSRFEIEKGTGEKVYYEVTRTEQIPANQVDMSKILATEIAGEHDIKLMTCSGRYNAQTKSFDDRFVVYAKQVK
jgi:hypothetical protein